MKSDSAESRDGLLAAGLALATAVLRVPALRALPIFGDEAIHLHWAELVRQDFARFAFVSLQDPKPPLHFWLLALVLPVASDPVLAGRLLSVFCGALSTALFFFLLRDLFRWGEPKGRALAGQRSEALCFFFSARSSRSINASP